MKKILLLFSILLFVSNVFTQYDAEKLAGVYQWCPFHCETIKLNNDFTFDYLLDGDLFNNQRTKGTWKFVAENKIYLKSPEKKLVNKVTEEQKYNSDKISIQVRDETGAIIPGIVIKINYLGSERQYITDNYGIVEIPKIDKIEVIGFQKSVNYEIKNSDANFLTVEIELNNEPFVDKTFLFKDKKIFAIFEDGAISEDWYKKINKKRADKLFPEK